MRRLFLDFPLKDEFTITGSDAKHLLYAMRVRPGQIFAVADTEKKVASAQVVSCTKDSVDMRFVSFIKNACTEPPISIAVAQCLPKGDKMDFIVQKAVELGADTIIPVVSRNCVVRYDEKKKAARRQKWQKISDEAAKQCGRTALPQIEKITDLQDLMQSAPQYEDCAKIILYEAENKRSIKDVLKSAAGKKKYLILIGPEGGFDSKEAELCEKSGFVRASLGPRILRTETASLAALSIIMYEKGDI